MAPAGLPGLVKQQHHSGGVRSGRVTKKHYRKPEQHLDPKKWHIKYEEIEHPYGLLIEIVPWDRNVDGYTRVALGHDIIPPCRQECIKERRKVYALRWECDNGQPRDLRDPETYLDRRGFLFPTDVVNSVMEEILSAGNVLKPLEEEKIIQNYDESKILQEMKEQFPNLDDMRVQAIYHHAWDTRFPDRVGHAFDLSVQRKVQKATWAHVRHNFTNYDSHYKYQDSRTYARGEVEMKCIKLMHELRGEIMEAPLSQWKEIVDLTKSDDETDDEIEVISALNLSPFNISPKQIANSTVYNNKQVVLHIAHAKPAAKPVAKPVTAASHPTPQFQPINKPIVSSPPSGPPGLPANYATGVTGPNIYTPVYPTFPPTPAVYGNGVFAPSTVIYPTVAPPPFPHLPQYITHEPIKAEEPITVFRPSSPGSLVAPQPISAAKVRLE